MQERIMTTIVIDRESLPDSISSLFRTSRIVVQQRQCGGAAVFSPVVNPGDFDNDTDYLSAIPGMMESIIASINAPVEEREEVPEELFNV
jgi:hypothetical protein